MKALKKIFLFLLVLAVLVAAVGFFLPAGYKVERSVTIKAKPEAVLAQVTDLRRWEEWSAWSKEGDPTLERTYSGSATGKDATMSWKGKKFGEGSMTITSADPVKGISYSLDFEHGRYISSGELRTEVVGEGTKVTWTNEGNAGMNPLGRYFNLLMDRMMGPDFEKGLNQLKARVEAGK